jgi:hypothetical protein
VANADFERTARAANALQLGTKTRESSGNEPNVENEKQIDVHFFLATRN